MITNFTAYTGLELINELRLQDVEREWKMRALAAQLPRSARPPLPDLAARALRALARLLDHDVEAATDRVSSVAV